jgi:hypothetical protein
MPEFTKRLEKVKNWRHNQVMMAYEGMPPIPLTVSLNQSQLQVQFCVLMSSHS